METTEKVRDKLAEVVVQRYRRAKERRDSYTTFQGRSFGSLLDRADRQFRREYSSDDAAKMESAFGFCPTRYYGLAHIKVNAATAWHMDLVVNNLDSMFTVMPTPDPTLDKASIKRIREGIKQELVQRMSDAGLADPMLLLTADGKTQPRIEEFLREQAQAMKRVEQARIVSAAAGAAGQIQRLMRDRLIESGFRQAYRQYTHDRYLYGLGVIRFPEQRRVQTIKHGEKGGAARSTFEIKPMSRHVNIKHFYPLDDGPDLQSNTGSTEVVWLTKIELINMARLDDVFRSEIEDILDEYAYKSRNWLESGEDDDRQAGWWDLDETIPALIHEGFFSGSELSDYGVTGLDTLDYVNARIIVVGDRTVQCRLLKAPGGAERTYFSAPYNKIGSNLFDTVGLAAQLWDTEQRINRLMHIFEHNVDWAARPPVLFNPGSFENPLSALSLVPGGRYSVEDRFLGTGSMPDSARTINTVSAQYHLILTQVGMLLRQADDESGIPAFSYSSQDMGRSSLGEYAQRMSNALRTIKDAALSEDMFFIEPALKSEFNTLMRENPEITEGQDINCMVRGMTGLLHEDIRARKQEQVLPALLSMSGQAPGLVPQPVLQYSLRTFLESAGLPVDALGLSDPMIEQALVAAAASPSSTLTPGGPQVPQLDGRSAAIQGTVAQPQGQSNFAIPTPNMGA